MLWRDGQAEEPADPELLYVWRWFQSLTGWREQGWGFGPLSHCEIEAWTRLMRIEIFPSEVEALRQVDMTVRLYEQQKSEPEKQSIGDQLRDIRDAHERRKAEEAERKERSRKKRESR